MSYLDNFIEICFSPDIKCNNIRIEWLSEQGVLIACEKDNCIRVAPDPDKLGLGESCIEGYVHCDDCKLGNSKPKYFKKCFCNTQSDCTSCQTCDKSAGKSYGVCLDQLSDLQKEQGRLCNGDCPPNKPFVDPITNNCVECREGSTHPDDSCIICAQGSWTIKCDNCLDGDCKDCLTSDDCKDNTDGRTKCGPNGCECESGYYWNIQTQNCELIPDCKSFKDCPDCWDCVLVNGVKTCVPIDCGPDKVCIPGKGCVKKCDCDNPTTCNKLNEACVTDNITKQCYCSTCNATTKEECADCEGFYWSELQQACIPNPCYNTSCANGGDCGPDCGCNPDTDQCEPCDSVTCTSGCDKLLGCKCTGDDCIKNDDPCAGFPCNDKDPNSVSGGCNQSTTGRPDCTCGGNGNCTSGSCQGDNSFTIEQTECGAENARLTTTLVTDKCCPCPTLDFLLTNRLTGLVTSNSSKITDTLDLRKSIANSTPLLTDEDSEYIMNNDELTSGTIKLEILYRYETVKYISDPNDPGSYIANGVSYSTKLVPIYTKSLREGINDLSNSTRTVTYDFDAIDSLVTDTNLVKTRVVSFDTIYTVSDFDNSNSGCSYKSKTISFSYTSNTVLDQVFKNLIFTTTDCALPIFTYVRGNEDVPFRKRYVPLNSTNTYIDYIENRPNQNRDRSDDTAIDDRSDLISGLPYRVTTNCGCKSDTQEAEGLECSTVYFADPCEAEFESIGCGDKIKLINKFNTNPNFHLNMALGPVQNNGYGELDPVVITANAQVRWTLKLTGIEGGTKEYNQIATYPSGLIWAAGSEFELPNQEIISSVEIRMNHDICEKAVITQTFNNELPDVPCSSACILDVLDNGSVVNEVRVAIPLPLPTGVQSAVVRGGTFIQALSSSSENIYKLTLLPGVTEMIIDITYDGGCTKAKIVPAPDDCFIEHRLNRTIPSCSDENQDYTFEYIQNSNIGNSIPGAYTWYNNNNTILGTESTLVISPYNEDGSLNAEFISPFTVEFVPTDTSITGSTEEFNVSLITPVNYDASSTGNNSNIIDICGNSDYTLQFTIDGCDNGGIVNYKLSDNLELSANITNNTITIPVPYNSSLKTEVVTILGYDLESGCCVTLNPNVYTINWSSGCVITNINSNINTICEGDTYNINITGSGDCQLTLNVLNTQTNATTTQLINFNGSGLYPVNNLTAGVYEFSISTVNSNNSSGNANCDNDISLVAGQTVGLTVTASLEIGAVLTSCTPVGGSTPETSDFIISVTTSSGNIDLGATLQGTGLTNLVNNNDGTYSGRINSGNTIIVNGSESSNNNSNCVNTVKNIIVDCSCNINEEVSVANNNISFCSDVTSLTLSANQPSNNNYEIIWNGTTQQLWSLGYTVNNPTDNQVITMQLIDPTTGCTGPITNINLSASNSLTVTVNNPTSGNCIYSVSVSGGSGNYNYTWNGPGSTGNIVSQLPSWNAENAVAGDYIITVGDSTTGCTGETTLALPNGCITCDLGVVLSQAPNTPTDCDTNDVELVLGLTGNVIVGNGPYEYSLDNGATWTVFTSITTSIFGLIPETTYQVMVRLQSQPTCTATSNFITTTCVPAIPPCQFTTGVGRFGTINNICNSNNENEISFSSIMELGNDGSGTHTIIRNIYLGNDNTGAIICTNTDTINYFDACVGTYLTGSLICDTGLLPNTNYYLEIVNQTTNHIIGQVITTEDCTCPLLAQSFNSSQGNSTNGEVGPFYVNGSLEWEFSPNIISDRLIIRENGLIILDTGIITASSQATCLTSSCDCSDIFIGDHAIGDIISLNTGTAIISSGKVSGILNNINGNVTYEVIGAACNQANNTAWSGAISCV